MNAEARPWWASADAREALDADQDPLTSHRRARRAMRRDDAGWEDEQDSLRGAEVRAGPAAGGGDDSQPCEACPVCTGLRLLAVARPELHDRLTEVGRHLTAAVRALVEPARDEEEHEARASSFGPPSAADEPS